ncbi:N-acyl-D-aspartate/D-glutamate deacylase [Paenibacillus phyllosphaerae]|uniref:N-acyl-D-aspartate/D-glutamate deacylase n=1 Tax=Paenibacillus phyllosphaerae TaxID=274593 RepID=A0A7W5AYF8_9BACL|nr:amidohydrolase family protein [Paenibacillus phyllosphaerae]MBB3110897.1 N-acyl-D-aspartate/D-glutamate deacylase [Paenibacillus phyllosphaerae]
MSNHEERKRSSGRGSMRGLLTLAVVLIIAFGGYLAYSLLQDGGSAPKQQPNETAENNEGSGASNGTSGAGQADEGEDGIPEAESDGSGQVQPLDPAAELEKTVTEADLAKQYDIVITGGRVINPETKLDQEGLNVGITGDTIEVVTAKPLQGKKVIDATGLVVSPGFIDNLSYDPNPLGVWQKIGDGVTSNIAMHGGTSTPKAWYAHYERDMPPVNFGASFFYTQARNQFKLSRYEAAKPEQIAKLREQAEDALNNGALGISFSLEYVPGISKEEIIPLMELAQEYNVPVYFHGRYSDAEAPGTELEGTQELITYAEETGAAVHIDHINSTGGTFSMTEALSLIDAARAQGYDITACTYPYDYWGTYLNSARFDEGWQDRFRISYNDLQIAGTTERLTEQTFRQYQKEGKLAVAYAIPPQAVIDAFKAPYVMIGSDAILEPGHNNHPRASGTFARAIGLYVREQQVMSLMDGIAKLSLMPAQRLEKQAPELRKKGRIAKGMDADIVIFDYNTINDRSTVEQPDLMSAGINVVIVAGQVALEDGKLNKKARLGEPLRSQFVRVGAQTAASTLQWEGKSYPVLSYNQASYVDLAALGEHGYSLTWDKVTSTFTVAQGSAAAGTQSASTPSEAPKQGMLMLQRGYEAQFGEVKGELLSIGDRAFVPISFLAGIGLKAENDGDAWMIEA